MRETIKQTDRISALEPKQKRYSWFTNSKWIMLLLMSTLLWQCEKDTFEGETTGLCPEVILTNPANDATNVITNTQITATFNREMVPASVNGETFSVKQGEIPVSGIVTYADKVAIFTPTKPLDSNKLYTGTITKKVKDPDGNFPIKNYVWNFTTGNVPRVIATDPIIAASSVPLNKIITATFSTAMNPSTINSASFLVNQGTTPITGTVSYTGTTATFTPTSPLADNTVYTGTITIEAKDVAGNAMASHYKWSFSTSQSLYTIIVSSNPAVGGSASGGGSFNNDTPITVIAAPSTGYTFTNWTEGATVVSTNASYAITVTSNRTLVANFTVNTFTLNVNAVNGTVTKVPNQTTFNYGTSVLLTATPTAGYSFTGWSGDATGTSNSLTITMNSNKNITANFALTPADTYTLNVTSSLGGTAVKNPNQTGYANGTSVQVTATPNTGYTFSGWSGDATGTTNPLSVTMNSDKNIVANFTLTPVITYSLNVIANNGVVVKNPNQANYNQGSTVQLTATPNSGYTFTGWSGDASGTANPLTVTMNSNKNITAIFTLIPASTYTLNVTAVNGTVEKNPSQATYLAGTNVQLTATPNSGYSFTGWSGDAAGSENPLLVQMNSNKNITAIFTLTPTLTYTLNVTAVNGTIVKNPNQPNYNQGTTVQLTATPNNGYTFSGWSGDASGTNNPLTVTMNSNKNITANFTLIPASTYTLNVTAVNGTVAKNPNQATYNSGSTVVLTATPNAGYTFTGWSGDATGAANPLSVTMNSNKNITANFELIPASTYTLNATAINGSVTKNPNSPTYAAGSTIQLTATPNTGYTFTSWGGDATGSTNPLNVTMNGNKEIVANFSIITYTLLVISVNGDVVKNPEQIEYNYGENVELTATPNSGYIFDSWSGDATGSTNPITVLMDKNKTVTANYVVAPPSGPEGIDLGSAGNFAILAGSGISNTGVSTMINGDVGSFPTATINGLLSGNVNGTLFTSADPIVGLAKTDLTTAFNDAQSRSLDAISLPGQIGGLTLAPGLYVNSTTSGISGTGPNGILTLDAGGNANAVWIFKVGSTFITDAGTSIVLAGGAQAKNIYWSVGTSATLGTNSIFYGNILADQAITLTTGATLTGRALTRIAAITLDSNSVTKP